MFVLKLMNENENWRDILSADPYNIIIKEDGEYVLLKYSQLNSDFTKPIVRECRGSIFRRCGEVWHCVCRAFDKFGNYGENYVPTIDWPSAVVQEKIDGSLMKCWYDKGTWHLSTNGTIDAFEAPLGDFGISFGDYFVECLYCPLEHFYDNLDTRFCYMFEMVGPKNRVVIEYKYPKLYGLGKRNMQTMEESEYDGPCGPCYNIELPKRYALYNLDEVVKVATALSKEEEGFVVSDQFFNRMKVKSPEYLMASHLANNGIITKKRALKMIFNETYDDFLAYCPQYKDFIDEVKEELLLMTLEILEEEKQVSLKVDRKTFASSVKNKKYRDYFFRKYDHPDMTPLDWIKTLWWDNLLDKLGKVKKEN